MLRLTSLREGGLLFAFFDIVRVGTLSKDSWGGERGGWKYLPQAAVSREGGRRRRRRRSVITT